MEIGRRHSQGVEQLNHRTIDLFPCSSNMNATKTWARKEKHGMRLLDAGNIILRVFQSVLIALKDHCLAMILSILERRPKALPATSGSEKIPFGVLEFLFKEIVDFPNQGGPTTGFHDTVLSLNHDESFFSSNERQI